MYDFNTLGVIFHCCCTCNHVTAYFTHEADHHFSAGGMKMVDGSDSEIAPFYSQLNDFLARRHYSEAEKHLAGLTLSEASLLVPVFLDDVGECSECAAEDYR